MRRLALFASISALVLAVLPLAPAQAFNEAAAGAVPGSYIVVLNEGEPGAVAAEHSRRHNSSVKHVYRHALRGYAARMSEQAAANVARDRRVAYVEHDGVVTASETQANATWGLDRIDQRAGTNGTYTYATSGSGVTAYVIDTGILDSHGEFTGRMAPGFTAITDGRGTVDCDGHGTHVAGTIGGTVYGVAKAVRLVPVRVLDCSGSGTWSGVIAGLDWVTANHVKPAVANMSLGGGASTAVDDAVRRTIRAGVTTVVAAGNGNRGGKEQDACGYSPARVPQAITVGATTNADAKTSWSNYGPCVDWFAPGAGITSAYIGGDDATNTISGTSMAAPHVAGTAALYLQGSPGASTQTVRDGLYATTTKGIVTSSNTANNHLAYNGTDVHLGDGGGETPNAAPIASFTYSCTELACSFDGSGSTDSGGSISSYRWSFGDGTAGDGATAGHTYDAGGTYNVTLTVTDNAGATGSSSQSVMVSTTSTGGFSLSASGYKVKGVQHVDLSWSGATSTNVDVFRNGNKVTTTANDGRHTDNIGQKGGGSYTYRVCDAGTSTCSATATVTF